MVTKELTPKEMLQQNGIEMITEGKTTFLVKGDIKAIRPDEPRNCYKVLKQVFDIDDQRFDKL